MCWKAEKRVVQGRRTVDTIDFMASECLTWKSVAGL